MTTPNQRLHPIPGPTLMLISGAAASVGEFCTIPFDTAKVRLQLQSSTTAEYTGLIDCIRKMIHNEGITSPWKGVSAGIQRQLAFAPIRIGLYEPVRNGYMNYFGYNSTTDQPTVPVRILAGLTTSAIGITVASPTDVVKVRLQAQARATTDIPLRYTGALDAYKKIIVEEGVLGLWSGYGPNLARNCIVNATELVAYDQSKQLLLAAGFKDNLLTHIGAGLSAGLCATLLGSPVDVVKTNVMNMRKAVESNSSTIKPTTAPFTGPISCATYLMRTHGIKAFYKGFIPNFSRIGSWNIITWVTLEQFKSLYYQAKGIH